MTQYIRMKKASEIEDFKNWNLDFYKHFGTIGTLIEDFGDFRCIKFGSNYKPWIPLEHSKLINPPFVVKGVCDGLYNANPGAVRYFGYLNSIEDEYWVLIDDPEVYGHLSTYLFETYQEALDLMSMVQKSFDYSHYRVRNLEILALSEIRSSEFKIKDIINKNKRSN